MATEKTLRLTFGYHDSNEKRNYTFTDFEDSAVSDIKTKINAINSSLSAGTDAGLSAFFTSSEGDYLAKIEGAVLTRTLETPLDLGGN